MNSIDQKQSVIKFELCKIRSDKNKKESFCVKNINKKTMRDRITYFAKRETVMLNFQKIDETYPVNELQKKTMKKLFKVIPEYEKYYEYKEYMKNKTESSADKLISRLFFNEKAEKINKTEYYSNINLHKPKYKTLEHGLFSDHEFTLREVKDEVSSHTGYIWSYIITLRREDADRLGYNSQRNWKSLIKSSLPQFASYYGMSLSNIRWYAAMHNTTHHPHVHLILFSKDPTEGSIIRTSENGSFTLSNIIRNNIYKNENLCSYQFDNTPYDKLSENAIKTQKLLKVDFLDKYGKETKKVIIEKIMTLAKFLPKDRKPDNSRPNNNILSLTTDIERLIIYENPKINNLYKNWCDLHFNTDKIYITDTKDAPVEYNTEFKALRKSIVEFSSSIKRNTNFLNEVDKLPSDTIDDLKEEYSKTKNRDIARTIGHMYNFGIEVDIDLEQAQSWYEKADSKKDIDNLEKQKHLSAVNVINILRHFCSIIDSAPQNRPSQNYINDKKLRMKQKYQRQAMGQAKDDHVTMSYDY